ncbi:MAG: hypothetical protein MK236_10750, partial [Pedosphaera sp.]|nr:hypothetical protein [Pedosphaera sp.]
MSASVKSSSSRQPVPVRTSCEKTMRLKPCFVVQSEPFPCACSRSRWCASRVVVPTYQTFGV